MEPVRYRRCQYTPSLHAIATGSFTRNHLVRPVEYTCDAEPHCRYGAAYCIDHTIALGLCCYGDFCIDPVAPGKRLCERHSAPPSVAPPAAVTVTIYVDDSDSEVRVIARLWRVLVGYSF